jgi:hypothetical protein
MKFILSTVLLFSLSSFAKGKKVHRHHEAHVHGGAILNIAVDQLKGKLEFRAASAGVVGFEHTAKSEKDKKTVSEAISTIEAKISQLIQFDSSLGCVFTKEKIELVPESESSSHSDFVAVFNITCTKSVVGSKVTFDFTSMKKIKDLDVTVLADAVQKTAEVKSKPVTLELK